MTLTKTVFNSETFDPATADTIASVPRVDYGFRADRVYPLFQDIVLLSERLNSTTVQVWCHNSVAATPEEKLTKPFLLNETATIQNLGILPDKQIGVYTTVEKLVFFTWTPKANGLVLNATTKMIPHRNATAFDVSDGSIVLLLSNGTLCRHTPIL